MAPGLKSRGTQARTNNLRLANLACGAKRIAQALSPKKKKKQRLDDGEEKENVRGAGL